MTTIEFYRASGVYGFLSNLWRCSVFYEGKIFSHAEQAYQFGKPKDAAVAEWIAKAPTPALCAQAGHALLPWQIRPDWSQIKVSRMRGVLAAKFAPENNETMTERLLGTDDCLLVEASKTDAFWGLGKKGNGKNMLGVLLMELRDELRKQRQGAAVLPAPAWPKE